MAASIVVDIKAQITGYQEQLDRIKAAASKIDIGSQLGKNLSREIAAAQKQLDALGKTPMPRLTSEGAIDSLTSKFNNIAHIINEIGLAMQGATFNDINVEEFNKSIASLRQQWLDTRKEFDQKVDLGIKDALKDAPGLRNYLKQIGVDLENLTAESAKNALAERLEQARIKAEQTAEAFDELKQKQQALQKEIDNMSGSNSLSEKLKKDLEQLSNSNFDIKKIADKDKVEEVQNKWKKQLDIFTKGLDLEKQKGIVNDAINSLFSEENLKLDSDGFTALANSFNEKLINALKDSGTQAGTIKNLFKSVFGKQTGVNSDTLIKDIFGIDEKAVQEAKDKLNNILQGISLDEISEKDRQETQELIDSGKFTEAVNKTKELLTSKINELEKLLQEKKVELEKLNSEVVEAGKAKRLAKADATRSGRSVEQLNALIAEKEQENAELKQRVEELENALKEQGQKTVEEIRDTGKKSSNQTAKELEDAANAANMYKTELQQVQAKEQLVGKIEGVVQHWFSIYAAVRMVSQAIKSVISTVQELDKTITQIAIVTDMSQNDLWAQMPKYTAMAREYATSIAGVYEVSQLFYQQGLQTNDVMAMTEQTLKMARISGLSYSDATNYMTNAVRSFKMEMQDAQTVVDVYSEIAASSATDTAELATAMSKTASSAESVGSSFENTTAMMAVMIEATREGAENIGSAMKSIISRYGEMKENPEKLIDSEGEEMSLNKVDKALQTVGISIHDATGQFREFDDVIFELAEKWDTIDKNTQRYIATVMAGNRQQSRFLALVSNGERLAELSEKAANSQDAATLQVLKTMDSIEAKTQQLKTSLQSLYTSTGVQNFFKGILDLGNNIIKTFTQIPTLFNLPILAIIKFGTQFYSLANIVITTFEMIKNRVHYTAAVLQAQETNTAAQGAEARIQIAQNEANNIISIFRAMTNEIKRMTGEQTENAEAAAAATVAATQQKGKLTRGRAGLGMAAGIVGSTLSLISAGMGIDTQGQRTGKGLLGASGSLFQGAQMAMMMPGPAGIAVGALTALPGIIEGIATMYETAAERAERLANASKEASNTFIQKKAEANTLAEQIEKLKELEKAQYDSTEARQEFIELSNQMAESNSNLVSGYDSEGNAIISLSSSYYELAKAREAALEAAKKSAVSSVEEAKNAEQESQNIYEKALNEHEGKLYSGYRKADTVDALSYLKSRGANIADEEALKGHIGRINPSTNPAVLLETLSTLISNWDDIVDAEVLEYFNQLIEGAENLSNSREIAAELFDDKQQDLILEIEEALASRDTEKAVNLIQSNREDLENIKKDLINNGAQWAADYVKNWLDSAGEITKLYGDTLKAQENTSNTIKRELSSYAQTALLGQDSEIGNAYLKEMESVNSIITQMLQEKFQGSGLEIKSYLEEQASTDLEEIQKQLKEFWNKTLDTNTKRDNFNNLIKNAQQYNPTQLREILIEEFNTTFEQAQSILKGIYGEQYLAPIVDFYKSVENRVSENTKQLYSKLQSFRTTDLGQADTTAILDAYDKLANMVEAGNMTDTVAANLFEQYRGLWEISKQIENVGDQQQVQGLLQNFDFSLESITSLLNGLNGLTLAPESETQLAELKASAEKFKSIIPVNLNTEIETFMSSLGVGMEEFEKALSSASKGMDFKTASEVAAKMGKTVSDFELRNGEFFIDNVEDLKKAYLGETDSFLKDLSTRVDKQKEQLDNLSNEGIFVNIDENLSIMTTWENATKEQIQQFIDENRKRLHEVYPDINLDTIIPQWEEWQNTVTDNSIGFIEWLIENLQQKVDNATTLANDYADRKVAETALKLGKLDQFVKKIHGDTNLDKDIANIQAFIQSGDVTQLDDDFKQYANLIQETYGDIASNTFEKMYSDSAFGRFVEVDSFNKGFLENLAKVNLAEPIKEGEEIVGYELVKLTKETLDNYYQAVKNNLPKDQQAKALAAGSNAVWEQSPDKLLQDVYKNAGSVTQETYERLISEFGLTPEQIQSIFKDNGDNTFTVNISALNDAVEESKKEISSATQDIGETVIQETVDNILNQISNASDFIIKGTSSPKAMQEFVTKYNELMPDDERIQIQDAFDYNELTKEFKLNNETYQKFIEAERAKLEEAGWADEAINAYLEKLTTDALAAVVDFDAFYNAENRGEGSKAYKTLESQMRDFFAGLGYSEKLVDSIVAQRMENALSGGNTAVQNLVRMAQQTGEEVTADQVEQAYRGQIVEIENAYDQLSYGIGSLISGQAIEILRAAGYSIDDIEGTNSAVITGIGSISKAYEEYYNRLKETGEATVAALNEAYADVLANNEEVSAIEALGDAASMTYQRFGAILAEKGIELTDSIVNAYTEKLGPNKIRIKDFSAFADFMGWEGNSEEYISAFKTYNDSLIEMNRQAERNIIEEVGNISKAKGGDWVNLTQLTSEIGEELTANLQAQLAKFGGVLDNGILQLEGNANLPAIINTIISTAQQYGGLLDSDMAALADALDAVLKSYAEKISKGIKGGLSNVEALDLQNLASSLDQNLQLNFIEAQDGLRLAQKSAIELHGALQKVDSMQAQLTFDALSDSLKEHNEHYENVSTILAHIADLQDKINNLPVSDARRKEYEAELEIAERIMNVRSSTDSDSFKFMDRKMPDAFNSSINYWNAAGKAYTAMNESAKSGYMEIQDFYNIINEMSNMAAVSGESLYFMGAEIDGSAENAAKLIQQGMSALTNVDGKGVKIALNNLAGDFQVGASDMSKGFDSGIKEMARAQISMLDAQIQMLEAIVAMEKLGDIDLDGNGIDYGELFDEVWDPNDEEWITKWDKDAQKTINELIAAGKKNPELQKAFESLYLGQYNLWEYLTDDGTKLTKIGQEGREKLVEAFNIIKDLAASDEFDLGDVQASVDNLLRNSGLQDIFAINYFNEDLNRSIVVKPGTPTLTVDWSDWTPEKLKSIGFNGKDPQQQAKDLLTKFVSGGFDGKTDKESIQGLAQVYQLTDKINVKKVTEVDDKGNKTEKDVYEYGGKSYDSLDEIYKLIAAEQQLGGESGSATIEGEGKEEKVVVTKALGKITYKISANEDGTNHYDFGDFQCDAANENDAIHQYYLAKREATQYSGGVIVGFESEEEFKIRKGIKIAPEYQVTGDFKNSSEAQSAAKDILNKSNEAITNLMKENEQADGSFKVPVGDVEFQLPPGSTAEDFKNKLREQLGLDVSLITEIAEGIKTAFSEGDAASQIGTAIAAGMTTALAGTDGKTQEVPIPEITIKPDKIKFDTTGLAAATKEQGSTAALTEISIDSIKVKPGTIVLDASGAQPTGEGATIPEIPLSSVKATVSTLELTSVASATLAEGVEPNLKDVAAKGDASSLELTLTALGATLAGGNTVNIEGAINSKGEVGTLAVTLAEGKQGILEHTGDVDVGNVGSVSGTSDDAKISATNYTVTFTKEDGSTETVEVEGFANLTATLSKYGVGFDENGNLQNVGDYKVTITPTDDNIELTTSANMEGVETNVAQYEANRVLKLKGEVDFSEESTEPESILNKTIQKNADLGDSYAGAISTATEGAIQNWQQYEDKVVEVVGTTGSLNSIDIDSLVNMGSFNENLGGVNVSLDNLMTRLQALGPQGQTVGQQIIDGLVAADASASDAAATNLGESFITNLKNALGVSSPSIYAQEAGQDVVQGLANGLSDISVAVSAAEALAKAINEALQNITIKPNISLENPNNSNKGGLSGLNNTDLSGTKQSTDEIKENINVIGKTKFSNLSKLNSNLKEAAADAQATATNVANIQNKDFSVTATTDVTENKQVNEEHNVTETKVVNNVSNTEINADTSGAQKAAADLSAAARKTVSPLGSATNKITSLGNATKAIQDKGTFVSRLASAMRNIPTNAAEAVSKLKQAMSGIPTGKKTLDVEVKVSVSGGGDGAKVPNSTKTGNFKIYSKGNFTGLAAAKGRKTLMGELGPELVVAGGRYYTVGDAGPEFVNLPDDAIVFNHLQTERLLKGKKVNGRGEAATTERNAVALAAGTTGPAMASASAALAALKEIRAMWQSMLDASAQSLGAQAGRGGGGGKGGKGGKGCFAAGTLITTKQGYKKIEDIQKGDIVLSYNEKSKQNEYSKVLQTMIHDVEDLIYTLYIQNEALTVTGIHKFLISGRGWIPTSELQIGDLVLFANGVWHQIDDIQTEFEALRVYNFEVSNNHNYYVGNNQVLAHNKGGGGGGGGGGDDGEELPEWSIQYQTVTEEIERWYNLIRQIDKIEQDIAYQAALRNKYESDRVANGEKIYKTYQKEYALLQQEINRQKELVYLQKSWYDAKREELANSTYGKIFTYDENGLQQYTGTGAPGSGEGLDILENLTRRNVEGKPIGNAASAKAQLAYLKRVGFDINQLRYNEDGTVLAKLTSAAVEKALKKEGKTWSSDGKGQDQKKKDIAEKQEEIRIQMMENFWSQVDGWKDELDSLYDSYNESLTKIEENQTKQNEILQKLVDNELSIEQDIIKAIEAREQAAIDALEEQKKVIEDANKKFLDGLNKQLSQEKELYNQNKKENDFTKLQRQLEILRRSGGSATQIKQLQDQIDSQMKDNYFDQQQKQIDAMQEASDAQIQRLDTQIDLMKTSLEYQKEHGLLWAEVRQMMADLTAAEVWSKISQWNPEYLEQSGLDLEESMRDFLERFGIYWEGKSDQSKFSEELSKQDFINDEELNKPITSSSLSETQKGEAQKRANAQAQEAYKNARMAGETEEEALEQAKTAYQNTAQQYINNHSYKNRVLEREGENSASAKALDTYTTNDNYFNKLSGETGWYSSLSSNQKEAFEEEYYKSIQGQYDRGEKLDTKKALTEAYNAIEAAAQTDRENGFNLLKNAAIYKKSTKNGKSVFTKQKQTLNKDTVFTLIGISGNYAQVQKKGGETKKYWVLKSMIPKEELAAYKTNNDTDTALNTEFANGTAQQEQYEKLIQDGLIVDSLNIKKGGAILGKNIKYKNVNSNGVNITEGFTDNAGKTKKALDSIHIKSIKGLKSNGEFAEVTLDKINGKNLTKAYKLSWKAAKKAGLAIKIRDAILAAITKNGEIGDKINYAYKQGGLVDYTGPAWVDGTKKQPEAFLNAKQTDFLRNDLLGNSRTSLLSIVSELREILDNTSSASVDNSNSVVIENIELNFESGVISNDYSAKRAGDMAMQEILKIARKTGANTISRR